jgi:serine/threonine-protein kinase
MDQTIGRYRILERVGRGGMGVLYRGIDPVLDREVAIKVMSAEFAAGNDEVDDESRTRFFREARAAAKLQHRNIVTIFEFAEEKGVPYIVMEFLRGRSLAARMRVEPPLGLEEKLDIVAELCTGLQFAHEHGVIHRDVKPANVWLLEDGTVKLLDFGIAKVSAATFTRHGEILGSASYMAPEQLGGQPADARADVFAAAVVLYELIAGRKPFESDSPTATLLKIMQEEPLALDSVVPDLPAPLVAAVARGLQKNPADRYQCAADLGGDLQLIRMSLQSAAETVFTSDMGLDETMHASGDSGMRTPEGTAVDLGSMRRTRTMTVPPRTRPPVVFRPASVPAPVAAAPRRGLWIAGLAAAVVLVAGVGWYGISRRSTVPSTVDPAVTRAPAPPPTVEPAPKAAAVLRIESDPTGASVELDGRDTGLTTPAIVEIGDPAPKQLRLARKGFQTVDTSLTDAAIATGAVSVKLPAAEQPPVRIEATGSYPFEVTDAIGRRIISAAATSHALSAPPGQVLRLRATTYLLDYPFKVDASRRTMELHAPELGRLTVRSAMETCQVLVNGADLGFPPINSHLVAAGTYSVQLKCADGQIVRGSGVTVVPGQTVIAKVP